MQEVNVYISEDPFDPVTVDQSIVGIHSGDSLIWEFHSADKEVEWALVEFEAKNGGTPPEFFEDRPGDKHPNVRFTKLHGGHGHVLGTAPDLDPPKPTSSQLKYWIRLYKAQPDPDQPDKDEYRRLDPGVIVCDP